MSAKNNFHPQQVYETLKKLTHSTGAPLLQMEEVEEYQIQIRPDKTVSLGKFLPDPLIPGGFKAHPTTIKAMRKDLFVAGNEEFADLEEKIICQSCQSNLDRQFWVFCPYCEAALP